MSNLEKDFLDKLCRELEENGWKEQKPQELSNFMIKEILERKVKELNRDIFENDMYKGKSQDILNQVYSALQSMDEVSVLDALRFGVNVVVRVKNTQHPLSIKLLDYENLQNNEFVYIREQPISQGNKTRYPDILLFANGIPLVIIEGKQPVLLDSLYTYWEGLKQIMRYQYEISSLFRFVQFGVSYADEAPYLPTFPRQNIEEPHGFHFWKTKKGNKFQQDIVDLLKPDRLLDIIQYFIFFTRDKQGNRTKIMTRYMQYKATKRAMKRIEEYLSGKSNKNKGLIWHWQGSGKTYTMFFIAYQFMIRYQSTNPVAFFVIDRLELESQLNNVLASLEHNIIRPKLIESIDELRETINNIEKEWGLKITTIQKFQESKLELPNVSVDKKNIVFLIDEAHRTQYGDLAAQMRKLFPYAIYLGFTGTPVFRNEKNTFQQFGYTDEPYLDVYFIKQSQEDGFTLPLTIRVVEEKGLEIMLTEDEIRAIIEGMDLSNSADWGALLNYKRRIDEKIKRRINKTKTFLENEKRIRKIVRYILDHIEADTENWQFKAMVVAASRRACVIYKRVFDEELQKKGLNPRMTEVVMSYQHNDEDTIVKFKESFLDRYHTKDWKEANSIVRENFLKKENPKVLIVTDMLLTGFDAPMLKVMYLDKPMYYHKLLQAVARVNRPADEKNIGLIVDSVGLVRHLKSTLDQYNYLATGNPEEIKEDLKNTFADVEKELSILAEHLSYIENELRNYQINLDVIISKISNSDTSYFYDLEDKISAIVLDINETNKKKIKGLLLYMKEALDIYKSLGGEPKKLTYKKKIGAVYQVYAVFKKLLGKGGYSKAKRLYEAIMREIYEYTIIDEITKKLESEIVISTKKPRIREAAAMYYSLYNTTVNKRHNPLYKEIYAKLVRLQKEWVTRNIGIEELIRELNNISKDINRIESITKMPIATRITQMIREYAKNKGISLEITDKLVQEFKEIEETGRLLESEEKSIRVELIKIMLKEGLPPKEASNIEEDVIKVIKDAISRER